MTWRLWAPLALALAGVCWLALDQARTLGELREQLARAQLDAQLQANIIEQIDYRHRYTMEVIDRVQRDKAALAARSHKLQGELAELLRGSPCVDQPVPDTVVERLRQRAAAANAAALAAAPAVAGALPDPGL